MQKSKKVCHFRQPVLPEKCFYDGEYLIFQFKMRAITSIRLLGRVCSLCPSLAKIVICRQISKTRNNIDISEHQFNRLQLLHVETHRAANVHISATFLYVITNELKARPSFVISVVVT
jgi:hypothetical protein